MTMSYGIGGASYSSLSGLKSSYKMIDAHIVVPGYGACSPPPSSFISDCNAAGMSPILNNGNDSGGGCTSSAAIFYANLANQGMQAAGGETECGSEDDAIMGSMIFMNYAGASGDTTIDVFSQTDCGDKATVSGHGCASYLEDYDYLGTTFTGWGGISNAATKAKAAGCKEVGILIGSWQPGDGVGSAEAYISVAESMISAIGFCSGFVIWNGEGTSMETNASNTAEWLDTIQSAGSAFTPQTSTTIKQRFGGVGPPTPTPGPPAPTPGTAPNVYINVRQRLYQAGID